MDTPDPDEFCARLLPRLIGSLALYCGDRLLAEELAQEALARAIERWARVGKMASPEAWTYRTAFNLARSSFRRSAAERRAHSRLAPPVALPDDADAIAIRDAVHALPPRQRAVIVTRFYLGCAVEETARVLGCRPGTVKAHTFKALANLRAAGLIDDDDEERADDAALAERLEEAVGVVTPISGVDDVMARVNARRRARRVRVGAVVLIVALLGVATAVATTRRSATPHQVQVQPHVTQNGDVLVFDDGYDGVLSVDLATKTAVRRVIEGQVAGDQPYRSIITDNTLVVGWNDVHAYSLATGTSRLLGTGVVIPAAEPGEVWLMPYGDAETYRLVDLTGKVLLEGMGLQSNYEPLAILDGLAFQEPNGIVLWNARTSSTTTIGSAGATLVASSGDVLAWCQQCDTTLMLTSISTDVTRTVPLHVGTIGATVGQFSPDSRLLAVQATVSGQPKNVSVVEVIDVEAGRFLRALSADVPYVSFAWVDDSTHLYMSTSSYAAQNPTTEIRRVDVEAGTGTAEHLPFGGSLAFHVVPRSEATALLEAPTFTTMADCPAPAIQPSGRTQPCKFRY